MKIYHKLSSHPRTHEIREGRRAVIIGGTGATGSQLIQLLLSNNNWERITSIGRRPVNDGKKHTKLRNIIVDSMHDLSSTKKFWEGNDIFFNCIGTTRKIAGGPKQFVSIEAGISHEAAHMAKASGISHASVISASGANHKQWSKDWIPPLLYMKTIGEKEQTVLTHSTFNRVSIFRPGMLIRQLNNSWTKQVIASLNLGLRVDTLAAAMIRDAESTPVSSDLETPIVYSGNTCIKESVKLKF